ncbi:MAG: choice-of-anchor J domain-containing protein [Saprospiraceae bacterium]|nr:choice-of-anchor J domain-containing protein [Saprospiraceae bacterium]
MFFSKNKNHRFAVLALLLLSGLVACVKTEFDEPPAGGEPNTLDPNITIAELKALHTTPGGYDRITDDYIIGGEVVMDDRSGNYYKTLVIQDASGGLEIKFNDGFLYQTLPIGRTIYIRCKDLLLTDYAGLTQLTGGTVEEGGELKGVGLTETQVRTKLVKGAYNATPVAPREISIADINPSHLSTFIKLSDVEFIKADTGKTYADAVTKFSLNRTLQDCSGKQLIIRTSGYSDFANVKTPGGRGTVEGVLGVFNNTYQLYLRDQNGVKMDSLRCGAIDPNGPGLSSLNEKFDATTNNQDIDLPGWVNVAVQGNRIWRGATFSGDKFASATAFQSNLPAMETWLITPPLDLRTQKTLSFESSTGFWRHDGLSVWVSSDFNGQNPATATWTQLNYTKPPVNASGYSDFVPSGNIPLPQFNGKGYIGFKYVGDGTTNTTTCRFDDVKVQ